MFSCINHYSSKRSIKFHTIRRKNLLQEKEHINLGIIRQVQLSEEINQSQSFLVSYLFFFDSKSLECTFVSLFSAVANKLNLLLGWLLV